MSRIVITGIGMVTPAGVTSECFWRGLTAGSSSITEISTFAPSNTRCNRAGEIKDIDSIPFAGKRNLWKITRSILFGYAAAAAALENAGIDADAENRAGIGTVFGSTLGGLSPLMELDRQAMHQGPRFADPLLFPSAGPSAPGCQVSITAGLRAFNTTLSNGQTSGLDAIRYGADFIRRKRASVVVAGAVEELSPHIFRACERAGLLAGSRGTSGTPDSTCRPFDAGRSGFVLGEGSAAVVLEDADHAAARKAEILAEVSGYGFHFESEPRKRPHAAECSMRRALADSGRRPQDVSVVFANANGSLAGDYYEAKALHSVFGAEAPPVTAIKSTLGDAYSAAGAIQAVAAILAMQWGQIPGTQGFEAQGRNMPALPVQRGTRAARIDTAMINTFGRSGGHASLILRSYVQ
jgi:3-oxoacyl-[acyl-carrier-protein] synthase II